MFVALHTKHFSKKRFLKASREMVFLQKLVITLSYFVLCTDGVCICLCRLYNMQQEEGEGERQELEMLKCQQPLVSLNAHFCSPLIETNSLSVPLQHPHPFEQLLKWEPRETAEQLSLIDSALYSRVDRE